MELSFRRRQGGMNSPDVEEPRRRFLGVDIGHRGSPFIFTFFISMLVVKLTRIWQTGASISGLSPTLQFPTRVLCLSALISLWIYGLMRFFRSIGWSRWLVLPYVLVVLCPLAWLFAYRLGNGGDFIALFLLQFPVVIAYALRQRRAVKA